MKSNHAGRPAKYTYTILKQNLINFLEDHKGGKITYTALSKGTIIPYHIWRDNKDIQKDINKANELFILPLDYSKEINLLPSVSDFIETNYGNKQNLIHGLLLYNKILNDLAENAKLVELIKSENFKLKNEITTLKQQLNNYEEQIFKKRNLLKKIAIKYTNLEFVKILKIKKDVISAEIRNEKSVSTNLDDLKEVFPEIF